MVIAAGLYSKHSVERGIKGRSIATWHVRKACLRRLIPSRRWRMRVSLRIIDVILSTYRTGKAPERHAREGALASI
jgi:hypothetical protein